VAKKSILERTNSWKPFVDTIRGALRARDYTRKTIYSILYIVDPETSMWPGSIWKYVKGKAIGPGFTSGREAMYAGPIEAFLRHKKEVFVQSPLVVVQLFNQLIKTLFSQEIAARFLLDEKIARRRLSPKEKEEAAQKKARKHLMQTLLQTSRSVAYEPGTLIQIEEEPSLFSATSPLDSATKNLIEEALGSTDLSFQIGNKKLIHLLEEKALKFQTLMKELSFFFATTPYNHFLDLSSQISPSQPVNKTFLSSFLTSDEPENMLSNWFKEITQNLLALREHAKMRAQNLEKIDSEKEKLAELLKPLLKKKDLKNRVDIILNELGRIHIAEEIYKQTSEEIDREIKEQIENVAALSKKINAQFEEFLTEYKRLEGQADFYLKLLITARWEIISLSVPYADLIEQTKAVKDLLLDSLHTSRNLFVEGAISFEDFKESVPKLLYHPEVRLIRGELTSRSLRLKDLKNAFSIHLKAIDRQVALLHLAGIKDRALEKERDYLFSLYRKLLNPYTLFKDAYNPDTINLLFRYWWKDLERAKARYNEKAFYKKIEPSASCLIRPITQTLDIIEKKYPSQSLYESFRDQTKSLTGPELTQTLTVWLREHSSDFITQFVPFLALESATKQDMLVQKLADIEYTIKNITKFAQSIQIIKTFEPERISSFLELFPTFSHPASLNISSHIEKMQKALVLLEEDLFIELGYLAKKIRLEAEYAVQKLIPNVLKRAAPLLKSLDTQLSRLPDSDSFIKTVSELLLREKEELTIPEADVAQDDFFAFCQKISMLFFFKKALQASLEKNSYARLLLLIPIIQHLLTSLRTKKEDLISLETEYRALWQSIIHQDLPSVQKHLHAFLSIDLKKDIEGRLKEAIKIVYTQIETCQSFLMPHLSFVPGDLEHYLHDDISFSS